MNIQLLLSLRVRNSKNDMDYVTCYTYPRYFSWIKCSSSIRKQLQCKGGNTLRDAIVRRERQRANEAA